MSRSLPSSSAPSLSSGRRNLDQKLKAGKATVLTKQTLPATVPYPERALVFGLVGAMHKRSRERLFLVFRTCRLNWFQEGSAARKKLFQMILASMLAMFPQQVLRAQDLTPRAYIITPIHSNAITLTYSLNRGEILVADSIPITNFRATLNIPVLSYYHSLSFFGRSANIVASLPYGVGNFDGNVSGIDQSVYRSGLMDAIFRFSVNLRGGPAMPLEEIRKWRQKTLLGASIKVITPTGQYDPTKLVNLSGNHWAFKPELAYSRRRGQVVLDAYGGVWFFTTNPEFFSHNATFPGTRTLSQEPVASFEGHLSYDVKPLFWISLDGNFWYGGRTTLNGVENPQTLQRNSRVGVTASVPVSRHQSLKFSYSRGAFVTIGGNFQNISVAWQYSWLGRPN
jgi:hypothetical protein